MTRHLALTGHKWSLGAGSILTDSPLIRLRIENALDRCAPPNGDDSKMSQNTVLATLLGTASIILCISPCAQAEGFDWGGDCSSGSDSFEHYVAQNDFVTVGTLPAGKRQVRIDLQSATDVDVQLIDATTGVEIIAWPNGLLAGANLASATYAGVTYRYSGYNGSGGQQGHEFIEVLGETNRNLVMKAFGYAAGSARVDYSWEAPEDCTDSGSGTFNQAISQNGITVVGDIPAGKSNVFVQLESVGGRDIDVQLYHGNTRLVVWDAGGNHGLLSGPSQESTTYAGMTLTYSGYNGRLGNPGLEFIRVAGTSSVPLQVKVFGYQSGTAKVDYSWGEQGTPIATTRPVPPPTYVAANGRIVAIGDLHGDYQATRRVLQLVGAMNSQNQWTGGGLIVVQVGDQLDRGDGERAIIDLLESLAEQSHAAGGAVYVLNGNHEVMNVDEDFRYVTSGGWAEFSNVVPSQLTQEIAAYPQHQRGRVAAFLPGGLYARILGEHNTAMVVGDTLFVHGGIHMNHVNHGLDTLNSSVQQWMKGYRSKPSILSGDASPIWSRRFSRNTDSSACAELETVLDAVGVSRMVVAHTVQSQGVNAACDGQVWRVDVGMSAHYGGSAAGLEIVGNYVTPVVD